MSPMPGNGIPIIRLTLEGMKVSILQALLSYEAQLAEETRQAVERFCDPVNIQSVIDRQVGAVITSAVHDEVERFFRAGSGRAVIREAVERKLRQP